MYDPLGVYGFFLSGIPLPTKPSGIAEVYPSKGCTDGAH